MGVSRTRLGAFDGSVLGAQEQESKNEVGLSLSCNVQSDLLRDLQTRVVVPLAKLAAVSKKPIKNLTPVVEIDSQKFVMLMPQLAGIPVADLGPVSGSVANQRDEIVAAMDFLISGI
jgi:toxin CcdB